MYKVVEFVYTKYNEDQFFTKGTVADIEEVYSDNSSWAENEYLQDNESNL